MVPQDAIRRAQEAAEDQRLQSRAQDLWRASHEYSCLADNETTPWLKHTQWPCLFRNRPLDLISASAQKPRPSANDDYLLGRWRGAPRWSPAGNEAKLRILMRATDQIFARAEATLAQTSYRWRCWLHTYHKDVFWATAFRALPSQHSYISVWKQFICYIFRVAACSPRERKQINNVKFRPEEVQMIDHILALLEDMEEDGGARRVGMMGMMETYGT